MTFSVYLAGPINGCTDDEAYGWRRHIKGVDIGAKWIDPLDSDFRGREKECYLDLVDADIEAIRKSDAVLAYLWKRDTPMFGTAMELVYARMFDIPVVSVMPRGEDGKMPFHPWVCYHSLAVVGTLVEGIEAIEQLLTM